MTSRGKIEDIAFLVSARIERRGFRKIPVVEITDGEDEWEFAVSSSFTIAELKERFPYFVEQRSPKQEVDTNE